MEYVIGVAVSLVVEALKRYFGVNALGTYVAIACVSVFGAGIYVLLSSSPFWPVIVQVIVTAGAFHNFIIRRF